MDVGRDQRNQPKYLNLLTDFSSKVHVRMKYRHTLCSHYTTTLKSHPDSTIFLCILTIPPAATCPEINGNLKTHKKKLHPTWWVSSLFCNLQTSIQINNRNSSNSDYSCSVNFSDRIVTLPSVCNVCRPQFKWITHKSSYSHFSCLVHFYNRIVTLDLSLQHQI